MVRGKCACPAVTRTVTAHTTAAITATLERMAAPAEPRHSPLVGSESYKRIYAMTNVGQPACHRLKSQSVVCSPAPSRPHGVKTHGKLSTHGNTISAV